METNFPEPCLIVKPERAAAVLKEARSLRDFRLSRVAASDLELLMNGGYSPLSGFMGHAQYDAVLENMRLPGGECWPIPIYLTLSGEDAAKTSVGDRIALRDAEGFPLAVMTVGDTWKWDKAREARQVYGTESSDHPGVARLLDNPDTFCMGGAIEGIRLPIHPAFKLYRHTPAELRALFRKMGWRRVAGFHTSEILHRGNYEMALEAMTRARANLLIHPVAHRERPGDIDYYTRIHCYIAALKYFPTGMAFLSVLPLLERFAGPREAVFHAIIRKNYGCTHFIISDRHADPPAAGDGKPFYEPGAAAVLLEEKKADIGIEVISVGEMVYVPEEDAFAEAGSTGKGVGIRRVTSEAVVRRIRQGRKIPEWHTFEEVAQILQNAYPPRDRQGFTVFCTGYSGAGKSTIAKLLFAWFHEMGGRPVTLLDGDIVRLNLSAELGFSKKHREMNVGRIGFVAKEITKNRGIAICAPIAPYRETRAKVRKMIEEVGGFIEVHVATPLEVCESRDPKGLYAKARQGLIADFTGIDDPYEAPASPEIAIDTTSISPEEAAQEVLLYLERSGYTRKSVV